MSDKIAREQLIDHFDSSRCWRSGCVSCDAIREALTESDIAHWMDRCHELEAKLAEKPVTVSRDDIDKLLARIYGAAGEYIGNKIVEIWLTELGIEVGDNSEVSRRTSDKEGV